jgi:protein tyrosine/serine phosphatase
MAILAIVMLAGAPFGYYRWQYNENKRLRLVAPGVLYRSGQMTAAGLTQAVRELGIRTIVNVQNEAPDPCLCDGTRESELARQLGVRYAFVAPDLVERRKFPHERPLAIDAFLAIMDDPANHPVLLHCRAGLHRTGVLTALYRIEYDGWTARQAMDELRGNGFGRSQATVRNDYVLEYVVGYQPRRRVSGGVVSGGVVSK